MNGQIVPAVGLFGSPNAETSTPSASPVAAVPGSSSSVTVDLRLGAVVDGHDRPCAPVGATLDREGEIGGGAARPVLRRKRPVAHGGGRERVGLEGDAAADVEHEDLLLRRHVEVHAAGGNGGARVASPGCLGIRPCALGGEGPVARAVLPEAELVDAHVGDLAAEDVVPAPRVRRARVEVIGGHEVARVGRRLDDLVRCR